MKPNKKENLKMITVPISGMHCRSCEIILEEKLSIVSGVEKVDAHYRSGTAKIYYSTRSPKKSEIEDIIRKSGYSIGMENREPFFSRNSERYKDIFLALLFLLGLMFVFRSFGFSRFTFETEPNTSNLSMIFLVGLTAGFSSCMVLIGGLVLGISSRYAELHASLSMGQKFLPHIFFNVGRIVSFALLGGVLGFAGSILHFSTTMVGMLTIFVGMIMFFLGLKLIGIFPRLERLNFSLPKRFGKMIHGEQKNNRYHHGGAAFLGAMTFFLPCGFTQSIQLLAVGSGSFWSGSLIMSLFALGTAPGLFGVGGIVSFMSGTFSRRFFVFSGVIVLIFSGVTLVNASKLLLMQREGKSVSNSNIPGTVSGETRGKNLQSNPEKSLLGVTFENGIQIARMTETNRGYSPKMFEVKKGIPVRWIIEAKDPYSCAASIFAPKIGVDQSLSSGENVIEFTPEEVGTIPFSCSMGMFSGLFSVIE